MCGGACLDDKLSITGSLHVQSVAFSAICLLYSRSGCACLASSWRLTGPFSCDHQSGSVGTALSSVSCLESRPVEVVESLLRGPGSRPALQPSAPLQSFASSPPSSIVCVRGFAVPQHTLVLAVNAGAREGQGQSSLEPVLGSVKSLHPAWAISVRGSVKSLCPGVARRQLSCPAPFRPPSAVHRTPRRELRRYSIRCCPVAL